MPTYEYRCLKCDHRFEAFQSMLDAVITVCPKCSGEVKRLIGSGGGIIFKGSGFFATDYRKKPSTEKTPCGSEGSCSECPVDKS